MATATKTTETAEKKQRKPREKKDRVKYYVVRKHPKHQGFGQVFNGVSWRLFEPCLDASFLVDLPSVSQPIGVAAKALVGDNPDYFVTERGDSQSVYKFFYPLVDTGSSPTEITPNNDPASVSPTTRNVD